MNTHGRWRRPAVSSATVACLAMPLFWGSPEASAQLTVDAPEVAASGTDEPAPRAYRARFHNETLARLNDDNDRGNADGVSWTASSHTLLVEQPGTYLVDGVVSANIRIAAATGTVTIAGRNKPYDDRDVDSEGERARFFNLRRGGDLGLVTAGPDGTVDAPGYLDSALVAVFTPNAADPTNPDSAIQAAPSNRATIDLHNFTIFGDGQNAVRPLQGNSGGLMSDLVVVTPPFGVSSSRPRGSGGGGVEIGQEGLLRHSFLKVGDDAIKPKKAGAAARDIRVQLQESGAAVQFGWSPAQSEGDVVVDGVVVNGWLKRAADGDLRVGSGESVIGGSIGGPEENYVARHIRVQPDAGRSFPNIVRLRFPEGPAVASVDLNLLLSAGTVLTGIPGDQATHSFVFLRPDDAEQQVVTLDVRRESRHGGARPVLPTPPKFARFFSIPNRITVRNR